VTVESDRPGNWGRWGEADERGTLNLLDAAAVLRALGTAATGTVIELGWPIRERGAPGVSDRPPPLHLMSIDGGDYAAGARDLNGCCVAEDYLSLPIHGRVTHVDALGHVWKGTEIFNGFSRDTVRSTGLRKCGIDKAGPVIARGVLLDIPAHLGVEHLDPDHTISAAELAGCLADVGVELRAGDAVLFRTGWPLLFAEDPVACQGGWAGLGLESAAWLAERDVSLIGSDNPSVERRPFPPGMTAPVHQLLLREYGVHMAELLDLAALAASGRATFLFISIPLRIAGGSGSPVNPVAVL
jgi:kynurenine formamidase